MFAIPRTVAEYLSSLGFLKAQQNERSALCLLALMVAVH